MSPERAKVFIAEDQEDWRNWVKKSLEKSGHEIAIVASSPEEALEAVNQLADLGVQVAIVDGNLRRNEVSGEDGKAIIEAIRNRAPDVKVIGFSGLEVKGADVNFSKASHISGLAAVVDEL